jgi:hypothetical protein
MCVNAYIGLVLEMGRCAIPELRFFLNFIPALINIIIGVGLAQVVQCLAMGWTTGQ